jgi:hypothetical protein
LINLLSDACLMCGFELKRKQIDQFLVEQASEDVLGLVKGPFSPSVAASAGSHSKKDERQAPVEAKPVTMPPWPPEEAPLQARAAVATESVARIGISSSLSAAAAATMVAEERRSIKVSPRDGTWTRSTFDVLIDALKQGRTTARE